MVQTFPLPLDGFFAGLPIASITFDLSEALEQSQTGAGEILDADLGPRLWTGEVTLGKLNRAEKQQALARIDALRYAGRSFFVYPTDQAYPLADPTGAGLAGATPQIDALGADTRQIALNGLPAGYQLSEGDFLAFEYVNTASRYALHKLSGAGATADALGVTPLFEVVPHIRPGATMGAAVVLGRPYCKARLVPDSVQPGRTRKTFTEGISFRFVQTLR